MDIFAGHEERIVVERRKLQFSQKRSKEARRRARHLQKTLALRDAELES